MPILHLLCGKIASGKTTLARTLAEADRAVLLSEDSWLKGLYGDQMRTPKDFVRCSAMLRGVIGPHILELLGREVSVVLDFQANTRESRAWMRGLIDMSGAEHRLHVLAPPDEVCLARLQARNAVGSHDFQVSDDQFHQVSRYFEEPSPDEGFTIVRHQAETGQA